MYRPGWLTLSFPVGQGFSASVVLTFGGWIVCCGGLSCALCVVQQHPQPLPSRCQQHPSSIDGNQKCLQILPNVLLGQHQSSLTPPPVENHCCRVICWGLLLGNYSVSRCWSSPLGQSYKPGKNLLFFCLRGSSWEASERSRVLEGGSQFSLCTTVALCASIGLCVFHSGSPSSALTRG